MVAMDGLQTLRDERARYNDPYDGRYNSTWEGASLKPYRTKDEYLYAMREDLAEWLSNLYDMDILPEAFFDRLENGALLCQHANNVRRVAIDYQCRNFPDDEEVEFVHGIFVKHDDIRFKLDAKAGTFLARDNISNFIHWCRHSLRINEVLLFESDDLVLRKNDKSFILCLLEVARRGGPIGMPVPMLVQLEQEIDRELNASTPSEPDSFTSTEPASPSSETTTDVEPESEADSEGKPMECASSPEPSPQRRGSHIPKIRPRNRHHKPHHPLPEENGEPPKQITLTADVLKTLDDLVRAEVNRCSCPMQFPMIREAEGKYRIGDSNTLIFVRILRKHVMVRVGGGWDTLTHYLDKHDPCRCNAHKKNQRRSTAGADFGPRSPKRKSSVKPSDVYKAMSGRSSDGTISPTESGTTRSNSPTPSPRHKVKPDVRPRSAVMSPARRQSSGDTYRPNSLNLSVRNSPRPLRRGNSFDTSPRFITSPDSSDTYSNPDLGGGGTLTRDSSLKRGHNRSGATARKSTPDSDSTACSEPVPMSVGSPVRRRNSSRAALSGSHRTSQTATEEFMRRKRQQQARAQSAQGTDLRLDRESVIQSAPTSPTRRRGEPLTSSQRSSSRPREMVRRAAVGAAEERRLDSGSGRESRTRSLADSRLPVRDYSASPSLSRRSSTPVGSSRKSRPQSANVSREDRRRASRTEDHVLMIKRGDDGRHRVDSTSSCESNDSSVKSGSRSLSGVPTRRLREQSSDNKHRLRSMSVERSKGINDKFGAASDRRRSLFERTQGDRKKSLDRSNSNHRKPSCEQPSSLKENVRSERAQPRARSLSRDWHTNSLPRSKASNSRRPLSGSASARGSPVRRRRSDNPLSANHLRPGSWNQTEDHDGSISSGASSPIGGATAGTSPATRSRLRPPSAIPPHLKPDHSVMTSLRMDTRRGSRPTKIPLPSGHKRLMEAQNRTRSNSLPSILADLLQAWQSVQNSTQELQSMDPFDLSPCRSSEGESVSPTSSVRTAPDLNHDSGYEDNANLKFSPNLGANLPVLPSAESKD